MVILGVIVGVLLLVKMAFDYNRGQQPPLVADEFDFDEYDTIFEDGFEEELERELNQLEKELNSQATDATSTPQR